MKKILELFDKSKILRDYCVISSKNDDCISYLVVGVGYKNLIFNIELGKYMDSNRDGGEYFYKYEGCVDFINTEEMNIDLCELDVDVCEFGICDSGIEESMLIEAIEDWIKNNQMFESLKRIKKTYKNIMNNLSEVEFEILKYVLEED